MTHTPLALDLDALRAETRALMAISYNNDGLQRTEVLWLCDTIFDLIWKLERDCPKAAVRHG